MTASKQWQLAREAAERYERILVPAILGPAAEALVAFAAPRAGETVLDVGCGTGAAARFAADAVGATGRVAGVDVNAGMIEVARSSSAAVEWSCTSACELPFGEAEFDVALCAQTLQFLDDRPRALREMHRVLKPGGRIAVSVWCDIRESPYFDALTNAVARHIGEDTAVGLRSAFSFCDRGAIGAVIESAGYKDVQLTVKQLELTLPALSEFVPRHVSATPMAAGFSRASPDAQRAVVRDVAERLASNVVPFRTHFVSARG